MPRRVILGCTGSVAAIKVPEMVEELTKLMDVGAGSRPGRYAVCLFASQLTYVYRISREVNFAEHSALLSTSAEGVHKGQGLLWPVLGVYPKPWTNGLIN